MGWLKRLWRLLPWVKKKELAGACSTYQRASLQHLLNLQAFISVKDKKFKDFEEKSP